MGYIIEVDHAKIRSTASTLRESADMVRRRVNNLTNASVALGASWKGEDYNAFNTKVQALDDKNSLLCATADMLDSFADLADETADMYIKAQSDAINKAGWLI